MTRQQERELPDSVECPCCGKQLNLLHWAHLRVHGYHRQADFRRDYAIDAKEPLHSAEYAQTLRNSSRQPAAVAESKSHLAFLTPRRRALAETLAQRGLFMPSTAAVLTGIPKSTIHSAMNDSRLPFSLATDKVPGIRCLNGGHPARLITVGDLYRFAQNHTSKRKV
ncbi:hypothetical protein HYT74_02805 [Candidatus Daviesbacteria bacterium]|nr:hypothetical protein [Candidatus Daviesbacteria bacterium]